MQGVGTADLSPHGHSTVCPPSSAAGKHQGVRAAPAARGGLSEGGPSPLCRVSRLCAVLCAFPLTGTPEAAVRPPSVAGKHQGVKCSSCRDGRGACGQPQPAVQRLSSLPFPTQAHRCVASLLSDKEAPGSESSSRHEGRDVCGSPRPLCRVSRLCSVPLCPPGPALSLRALRAAPGHPSWLCDTSVTVCRSPCLGVWWGAGARG